MRTRIQSGSLNTAADFIATLSFNSIIPSKEHHIGRSRLWGIYAKEFAALKPTLSEFNQAKISTRLSADTIALMEARLNSKNLKTASEFLETLKNPFAQPKTEFINALSGLWIQFADDFAKLNPTNEEFKKALLAASPRPDAVALIKARLKFNPTLSADDIIATFEPKDLGASQELLAAIDSLRNEYLSAKMLKPATKAPVR